MSIPVSPDPDAASSAFGRVIAAASLLIFALALLPASATGQARITLEDAMRIALDQNIELKQAQNQVRLQEQNVAADRGAFLPNLNASVRPSRSWGLTFDQTTGRLVQQKSDFLSGSLSSGVNVFNGFADIASLRQSQHQLTADEFSLERQRETVFFSVVQAYLQVLLDTEQLAIRAEDVEAQRQQLTRIEEFTRLGARPISDQYAQEATLASSELTLLEAERALQLSKVRLIQVLELDPRQTYEFDTPDSATLLLDIQSYDLDGLLDTAISRRADLLALEASIAAAGEGVRIARSGQYPTVNANAGFGSSYSSLREQLLFDGDGNPIVGPDGSPLRERVPFGDQWKDNRSGSFSVSLNIPLFNRFITRTNVERSRVAFINRSLDKQNLEQSVALEVRQAYLDYQTAAKRLDVTEKQLRSAEQATAVEQERYNVGASTLVELTQSRASLVNAQSSRTQAIYQFVFQGSVIDYYLGTLDLTAPVLTGQ